MLPASMPMPITPGALLAGEVVAVCRRTLRHCLMHLDAWPWHGAGVLPWTKVWSLAQERNGSSGESGQPPESFEPQSYHEPVMPREVMEFLQPSPGKMFLDATLGGGGHSELLLDAGAQVVAFDQDADALDHARQRLRAHVPRFCAFQSNFRHFPTVLEEAGIGPLDGIIADLGVSSHQLDDAVRGFSFNKDGPLDMRMDQTSGRTAADLINQADAAELEHILRVHGDERHARRIVRAIIEHRRKQAITTTLQLADIIASVMPRKGRIHPATRSFQAIRIALNEEMEALSEFLTALPRWLKPGARAVLLTFHSEEDRMVKQAFAKHTTEWLDRPEWPEPRRNPDFCLRLLNRKPIEASPEEVERNPRSRSAKLRAVERTAS